jgi:hypothetical protein
MLKKVRKTLLGLAVLGAIAVGASAVAGAASNSGTTGGQGQGGASSPAATPPDQLRHGPGETLLTDGNADKVKQAALDKVSGATVIRVETDAQGSAYEAHLQKPDGSEVTVKLDKDFKATGVENGFGPGGPPGGPR